MLRNVVAAAVVVMGALMGCRVILKRRALLVVVAAPARHLLAESDFDSVRQCENFALRIPHRALGPDCRVLTNSQTAADGSMEATAASYRRL